jgi:branched-chain amino acid aminotransferase
VCIPNVPRKIFLQALHLVVSSNAAYVPPHSSNAALYIRPLIFSTEAHLPLTPAPTYVFAIYVQPLNAYHGTASATDALILETFDRAAPRGTGAAKVGGNYAPVLRWSEEAKREGFGITLHLDSATHTEIDEFSTSGAVCVKERKDGGFILAVPDSKNVVKSITSLSVVQLARRVGWDVEVRSVSISPGR